MLSQLASCRARRVWQELILTAVWPAHLLSWSLRVFRLELSRAAVPSLAHGSVNVCTCACWVYACEQNC